jgi:hypothetical protein
VRLALASVFSNDPLGEILVVTGFIWLFHLDSGIRLISYPTRIFFSALQGIQPRKTASKR